MAQNNLFVAMNQITFLNSYQTRLTRDITLYRSKCFSYRNGLLFFIIINAKSVQGKSLQTGAYDVTNIWL